MLCQAGAELERCEVDPLGFVTLVPTPCFPQNARKLSAAKRWRGHVSLRVSTNFAASGHVMGGKGLSRVSVAFLASVLVVAVFASVAARPAFFYDEERETSLDGPTGGSTSPARTPIGSS